MKSAVLSLFAAVALAALAPLPSATVAEAAKQAKTPYSLKGTSYLHRKPYVNLHKSDLIATRKFTDPALGPRAQGAPFDNGFFFETPLPPFGGYTPYMQ